MRHIDPQVVRQTLPNGWAERAQQATTGLGTMQTRDRSTQIDNHSEIWRDLKGALKTASSNKCWYCESIDIRSDNSVDHFRPKNAVAESPEHGGYWWLAFRWENFRFSCTYCNSHRINQTTGQGGGKTDHFPLRDETRRARSPNDNLDDEEPLLLDPTIPADPGMLWFDENGQATPGPVCGNEPSGYLRRRADTSIRLYHLNHPDLTDQRKALCSEIRRRIEEADLFFKRYSEGDGTARHAFEGSVSGLKDYLSAKGQYSAAARAMFMGLRGTHPFADVILTAA